MTLDELKKYIELAEAKYREHPKLQRLVNTVGGAGIGYGLGSIELSKDPKSRWRGNLFGTDKGVSRGIGALAGAVAGLHAPTLKKKAEVDWNAIKGNINWSAIKQKIQDAKNWYESRPAEQRALIGAGVGLGGGALLGKLMGRTGTGAVAGAVAGAGAGAYWKDLKKVIEATKPVASDAAKKTKDRVSQLMQKVRPKSTQGEKAPSGERDAIEKAVSASLGGYADRFMKDLERTQAEGLPPQGVNLVVR